MRVLFSSFTGAAGKIDNGTPLGLTELGLLVQWTDTAKPLRVQATHALPQLEHLLTRETSRT